MSHLTRRSVVGGSAALLLASCSSDEPPPAGSRRSVGTGLPNSLLVLEHTAVAAYDIAVELLRGEARRYARRIVRSEREHIRRLEELVSERGGQSARPRTAAEYARSFPRLGDGRDALRFARDLEERLIRAYLGVLPVSTDPAFRLVAAEICAEEGAHLAVVDVLRGGAASPRAFVTGTL